MKKVFYLVAALVACYTVQANASDNNAVNTYVEVNYAAGWENQGTVKGVTSFGRNGTGPRVSRNSSCAFEYNSDTGSYRIYYMNDWRNVQYSNRDDFQWMFSYNNIWHYFNF